MNSATELLAQSIGNFVDIYVLILIVRILLSWFQTTEWGYKGISLLSPITDPYLNIFRSFIPPLGGIDLSPIVAILLLQVIAGAI